MALDLLSPDHSEEDYIDMEVSSYSNFFCNNSATSSSPPPHNPREFEFQMSNTTREREPTTSPADELFYKGKLLPLHLPPRLQMVEKLLQNSNISSFDHIRDENTFDHEFFSTPLMTTAPTPTATSTPYESCNISPSESFRISREINPEEYMYEYSTEFSGFINGENPKKSLAKKLKQSSLGSKLKASRAYLKSLFGKSGCSDESSTAARKVADEGSALKSQESSRRFVKKDNKKNPFGQIQRDEHQTPNTKEKIVDSGRHRRSFSLALSRHSANKPSSSSSSISSGFSSSSSSSSSSNNSNGVHESKYFKRCGSANYSEIENSIQGAIAHCKQSQQLFCQRKASREVGLCSMAASRIGVCEEQEKPDLCRG
ncbi:hypothetical protein L484_017267 [Morus notabilis]|uniref:Membrane-associated kinase regulator 4 n=1 Tax=Morus notabilis TaxID=981085 RepID=W9RFX3_9ROSA|nr:probable membrane-associated kinase regulator 4 [Morus notabilis]EXB88512.1 hypothetical protein L484_017267 [Morus notabilis]